MKKKIAILGSTGSIGTQALEVVRQHREEFEITVLTAGRNAPLLIEQALQFVPKYVVIADETQYGDVKDALSKLPVTVMCGNNALSEVVTGDDVHMILAAMVGFSGLLPTVAAVKAGKHVALANKETMVVAGSLITALASATGSGIYPVDSEHSAIFQCLEGEKHASVEKIILTASGGPFRGMNRDQLSRVTCKEALKHPNWCMGNKVTIDSASLMNKGLEVIEASWLFNMPCEGIEVIIHPQSIIHSLVEFTDGSLKAQMGLPDMRLPIQYALGYPDRLPSKFPKFSFTDCHTLTFEKPDRELFRNLNLAFEAIKRGGNMPCIMNAANEVVVAAFLRDEIRFLDMPVVIETVMDQVDFIANPTLEDLEKTDGEGRRVAGEVIRKK